MSKYEIEGRRVLEVGCGMALSSLLINRRGGDITATDYHPEAGAFLQANTLLNEDAEIPYFRANWHEDRRWTPTWTEEQREKGYAGWRKAVQRTLDWVEV